MAAGHDHSSGSLAPPSGGDGTDLLSDVLRTVRLAGAMLFLVDASSPWIAEVPAARAFGPIILPRAQEIVSFHIVTRGTCWGGLVGAPPVKMETGDVILFPHGDAYVLSSAAGLRAPDLDACLSFFHHMAAGQLGPVVAEGGGGLPVAHVACGFLGCDARPFNPVIASLPRMIHLPRAQRPAGDRLDQLIELALAESRETRSGARCVLLRLAEVMFVEVLRRVLGAAPPGTTGWLAGLRDPVAGHALSLLHEDPARPWTLDELARRIGQSRSTLAERFNQLVGEPPMQYLARWRMQLAARMLADGAAKVSAIAQEVGYESEAAFSRAFKKLLGESPAVWRRRCSA